jgi:hypothetical protein
MTLIIQKPAGAELVLRKELPADAEADAYIAAVEAADGQALEPGVKFAIKNFVLCCKDDGIWNAIKASCILAGARTLTGALVPLVGTAPTNVSFVSGDYNRKTGLVGDGSTKYLDSNRNNNADPQNNQHMAFGVSQAVTSGVGNNPVYGGTASTSPFTGIRLGRLVSNGVLYARHNSTTSDTFTGITTGAETGLLGISRSAQSTYVLRARSVSTTITRESVPPVNANAAIFALQIAGGSITEHSNARLAFYSIGESLDLALLDARVTDLINAFAAAIP